MPEVLNRPALEPLFGPADIPNFHRVRSKTPGAPAEVKQGRRPSPVPIAQVLRHHLAVWRDACYAGASDTSIELLQHWFGRSHFIPGPNGESFPFSYYFCQREAIETLIYLFEVRGIRTLSGLTAEFSQTNAEVAALGVNPEEDLWPKYAFKVATGAGKTKIMSLAMVWSYFHSLRESDSPMARHFVLIAPGITVFERLKEDFGSGRIFDRDPLIPTAWRGDWNVSVVLQDEASGASTGGTIYLTNIHRLYDNSTKKTREPEMYSFAGPPVSKAKALDLGQALRERVTSHQRVMVLNDEAHHVWDPESAWNEAITFLHETTRKRGGGLVAQLDFSATPRNDKGQVFQHVICDTPLGEAVDAGIVKTPIIGHGDQLVERHSDDAAYRYEHHLSLGYKRWLASKDEWDKSGKKALLFVMTEDTASADAIAKRLNSDPLFQELNGKTINLHTNLKGKLKKRGKGANQYVEFVESEKDISDEDLKALRKLSRELDDNSSPYRCIVSVLMLREGWDVRNVTTIVPLRPLTAKSRILPEQTLGRGLRRMTPPGAGQAAEVVVVVEHKAFTELYKEQLNQEGLPIEIVDIDDVPKTTVTIFPDAAHKDLKALDILIPRLSQGYRTDPELAALTIEEVRHAFQARAFKPLPLGQPREQEVRYEGRHLITQEVVEKMTLKLPLLEDGVGAISFFREELERATKIRGQHAKLAPVIQAFLEEVLFEERVTLYDQRIISRLADLDVREHIRATFIPLILKKVILKEVRVKDAEAQSLASWGPFQASSSERRPAVPAKKTLFNLVPCDNHLEVALSKFADLAGDIAAFAKNAGPRALRIDYLTPAGRRAIYTPDFLLRKTDGTCLMVETKGRADADVAPKARAAVEWCKGASTKKAPWEYVYVPQNVFEQLRSASADELARACAPSLADLLKEATSPQLLLNFEAPDEARTAEQLRGFGDPAAIAALPSRYRKAIEQAVALFHFLEKKSASLAPVFQPLLGPIDHAAEALLVSRLSPDVPAEEARQKDYFEPDMSGLKEKKLQFLSERARTFKRLLVHKAPLMPTGLLGFCLQYAASSEQPLGGVFTHVRRTFTDLAKTGLKALLDSVYEFRNTYVAHKKEDLVDANSAKQALGTWIEALQALHAAYRPEAK